MLDRMTVHQEDIPIYDICLQLDFSRLDAELEKLSVSSRKICVVTDSNVNKIYGDEVTQILNGCGKSVTVFVFPAGEESKNLNTVRDLYKVLILNHFDRKDLLVALGGGVVGDLCGYGAATYLRGVDFIQIPTTLLSQVDSSIGGKTGVDFDSYKNMVGAFHMPRLVYTNVNTLLTLSEEQFSSGMGEIIKHGLIQDRTYYDWILECRDMIVNRNLAVCAQMIHRSDEIKRTVVEADPREQGKRAILNFGHTLGHAIEKLMDFRLLHGHCVGIGALAATYLSAERGYISTEEVRNLRKLMMDFHMPVQVSGLQAADIIQATKSDKKMEQGVIKFILLKEMGEAYIDCTVTDAEMSHALSYILT